MAWRWMLIISILAPVSLAHALLGDQTRPSVVEEDDAAYDYEEYDAQTRTFHKVPFKRSAACEAAEPKTQAQIARERVECSMAAAHQFEADNGMELKGIVNVVAGFNVDWLDKTSVLLGDKTAADYCDVHTVSVDGRFRCPGGRRVQMDTDYHCVVTEGRTLVDSRPRLCDRLK